MTPRQFLNEVVQPNIDEFYANIGSKRHAFNVVAAVDALAAHIFVWCKHNAPQQVARIKDDTAYRLFGVAFAGFPIAARHRQSSKACPPHPWAAGGNNRPQITRRFGGDEAAWDQDQWDRPPHVVVTTDNGRLCFVTQIIAASRGMLEIEMVGLGM